MKDNVFFANKFQHFHNSFCTGEAEDLNLSLFSSGPKESCGK